MIIIFCLNFVLHIIITALKIKKYSCSVDHLKSLEIKMKRKAELAARHTVNIIKISKQDRKLNSQGSPSQQVLKQFWKTPRSQADWNWDCGMQQFHQHMGRKYNKLEMQGREGVTLTVVLGALGHGHTRCGGTACTCPGNSHKQWDLKPANKALDKANLWEEDGVNTLPRDGWHWTVQLCAPE